MITTLNIQNFKSWQQTGDIQLGSLTGIFGTNSSGKTSLLQFLLMLKQTAETADRSRVLHTGNDMTLVDLGTFYDIIYAHKESGVIDFHLAWNTNPPIKIPNLKKSNKKSSSFNDVEFSAIKFNASIEGQENDIYVKEFAYQLSDMRFGMERQKDGKYKLIHNGFEAKRAQGRKWLPPAPVKSYGFPDPVFAYYQKVGFLSNLVLAFEQLMGSIYYLGPLREYPSRSYLWAGERPTGVGRRGEQAIPALLASREQGKTLQPQKRKRAKRKTLEEYVVEWLKTLGVIHDFKLKQIADNRKDYEVRITTHPDAPEVLITDVGFGVSQVLPVIVLCFYAPEGSTIILEQPEIHLHPSIQAGLADVFIDAIKTRGVQIILESHSEHLLTRLQRRIAEEQIDSDNVKLYFAENLNGISNLSALDLDVFGNIRNWPVNFFGDSMKDLTAMTNATINRQSNNNSKHE